MTKGFADMPILITSSGREVCADRIGDDASEYLPCMFSNPPEAFVREDATLEVMSRLSLTRSTSTNADTRQARHSATGRNLWRPQRREREREMIHACDLAYWYWAVALNTRFANGPAAEDIAGNLADPAWHALTIRLVSKCGVLKFLRPIAILPASANLWSKVCFHKLPAFDVAHNEAHLGFCPGCSCVELVTTTRLAVERRLERGMTTRLEQWDFARAYDSVVHSAPWLAMRQCRSSWHLRTSAQRAGRA